MLVWEDSISRYGISYGFPSNGSIEKKVERHIEILINNKSLVSVTFKHAERILELSLIDGHFHVDDVTKRFAGVSV